ncbi:hypothetical protein SPI_07185 [Niveomyces insectorum RCEF 264]|uniref:Rhodopsin domain-containing protein n=1 Tax=Niveomyces insectorum RCEF 264 TaxID=1081102 RepID=A0A167QD02_9HYPO|nr:hypothetical protein SPI_07185 [Niveomyces insectorum RCEF 264]
MAATPDLSRGPVLLAISITTGTISLSTCVARLWVRRRASNHLGFDDYAIGVSGIVGFVGTVFSIIEGSSMVDSSHALEFDWLGQPWFMMGTTLAKISICFFFIRLVGAVKQWRILLSSQILLMAVLNLAFSLTTNLQCRPLQKLWDPTVPGECWNPNVQLNIGYFQGGVAFSVFWWLFLSLFPVMIVRDFEMHQRMRWPFYFLSSLSLMAAVFATVRTYETSQTVPGVFTFDAFFATVLSILEQNVGIVAANVLPLGSLFWVQAEGRTHAARSGRGRGVRHGDGDGDGGRQNPFESDAASIVSSRRGGGNHDEESGHYYGDRRRDRSSSSRSSVKRSSMLIIEGPREANFVDDADDGTKHGGNDTVLRSLPPAARNASTRRSMRDSLHNSGRRRSLEDAMAAESFWPRGIIKTVEVEVVEEDVADVMPQHSRVPSSASNIAMGGGGGGGGQGSRHGSRHGSRTNNGISVTDGQASRHSRYGSDSDWATLLRSGPTPPASRGPSRQGH